MSFGRIVWRIFVGILCLSVMFIYANVVSVPMDIQTNMLLKTIGYDRTILKKDVDVIRIGIVYNEQSDESMKAFEKAGDLLYEQKKAGLKIGKKRIKSKGLSYHSESALRSMVENLGVSVLYVTPGNEANLTAISRVAKAKKVLTFGGGRDYIAHGLAVGIEMDDAGKYQLIVSLANAKAQGANFKAEFLKLASVIE